MSVNSGRKKFSPHSKQARKQMLSSATRYMILSLMPKDLHGP